LASTFGTTVPTFFCREKPISSSRKPACMKSTRTAATITQTVSTAVSASVSDGFTAILQRLEGQTMR
jgi:hypothetical protein